MQTNPAPSDWTAARGEKWRTYMDGMEAMLAPVDGPLAEALDLGAPCRIAEVGCGGGGTALELLRRAPAGSSVHGFDVSPTLVEAARARVPGAAAGKLTFDVADMATSRPPDGPYDRLCSRFGVMFFADDAAAFANLRAWLAPTGRFGFAVWGPPADNPWEGRVRDLVGSLVALPPGDPAAPGPFRYADAAALVRILEAAGFAGVTLSTWRGPLPIGGGLPPEAAARFALASFSSFAEALTKAGGGAFDEALRRLTAAYAAQARDGAVWMDASVHIVSGTRGT